MGFGSLGSVRLDRSLHVGYDSTVTLRAACLLFLAASATATNGFAQSVEERQGNIWFIAADGSRTQLTSSGLDFFPSLSFSGTRVVFIRNTPDFKIRVPVP